MSSGPDPLTARPLLGVRRSRRPRRSASGAEGLGRFAARRLAQAALVILGVIVLTFVVARLVPGDPARAYAGPRATPAQLAAVRRQFGLDRSTISQLWHYLTGIVTGNWGIALHTRRPVLSDLGDAIPPTLELVLVALLFAVPLGVAFGRLAARRGGLIDAVVRIGSIVCVSAPIFLVALALQYVFAQKLKWLPIAGEYDPNLDYTHPLTVYTHFTLIDALIGGNWPILGSALTHLVLPAVSVGLYPCGVVTQMTRASLLEQAGDDHVRMARSLGFPERTIFGRLAMRQALGPVASVTSLMFAYALTNTFLVEAIFDFPGLGSYAVASINALDTNAITGVTLFVAIIYVLANLAVDLVQARLDPRTVLR